MKKIYILIFMLSTFLMTSQNNINFDASSMAGTTTPPGWSGFMNVSNKPADGGAYQFGSSWGLADLVALVDTGANTVTLKPNRIGDTNIYWQTPGVLEGNKIMDASIYIEDDGLAGTSFSFNGEVISNTLNSTGLSVNYVYTAFIKVFAPDYSSFTAYTNPLAVGNFTIALDASQSSAGQHIQYGFEVIGVNINSDPSFNTDYDNLGSIVIGPNTALSVDESVINQFSVYPNPTQNVWTLQTNNQNIIKIDLFDMLGKLVSTILPNTNEVKIDASSLVKGLYFARISSNSGVNTVKLIRN